MKDFLRLFECHGVRSGSDSITESFFLVIHEGILSIRVTSGQPTAPHVFAGFIRMIAAYEALFVAIERPIRPYPIRFIAHSNGDGIQFEIEEEIERGYPRKKIIAVIGANRKISLNDDPSIYDMLDLLLAKQKLNICDGKYILIDGGDGFDSMVMVNPRATSHEPGWTSSHQLPILVVE